MAVMTERDRKKAAKKSALRIGGIITIVLMYLCGYAGGIMQDFISFVCYTDHYLFFCHIF